jgi:acetyl-CoA carboxylase biotin carboxyl carrier protein
VRIIVSSSEDAIKRVIEAFERSGWSEIDIRTGTLRVHLSASTASGPSATPAEPAVQDPTVAGHPTPLEDGDDRPDRAPAPPAAAASAPPAGSHVVVSPSPGIFWCSPEPGAPPFVEVGKAVEASETVCIIEVMKLMNHVKAGVGGEVVAVYVDNGVAVGKGQPLFAVVPPVASGSAP